MQVGAFRVAQKPTGRMARPSVSVARTGLRYSSALFVWESHGPLEVWAGEESKVKTPKPHSVE